MFSGRYDKETLAKYVKAKNVLLNTAWAGGTYRIELSGTKIDTIEQAAEITHSPILYAFLKEGGRIKDHPVKSIVIENTNSSLVLITEKDPVPVYYPIGDHWFCENERERDFINQIIEVDKAKDTVSELKAFLEDPWKEYNTYKEKTSKKLEKIKKSTEWNIKERTKLLPEWEKKLEELEEK